jgi:hypothetical protein
MTIFVLRILNITSIFVSVIILFIALILMYNHKLQTLYKEMIF